MDLYFIPYTEINSKWINYLNVRPETIKQLGKKKKREIKLLDISLGSKFRELTPKAQATKKKKTSRTTSN